MYNDNQRDICDRVRHFIRTQGVECLNRFHSVFGIAQHPHLSDHPAFRLDEVRVPEEVIIWAQKVTSMGSDESSEGSSDCDIQDAQPDGPILEQSQPTPAVDNLQPSTHHHHGNVDSAADVHNQEVDMIVDAYLDLPESPSSAEIPNTNNQEQVPTADTPEPGTGLFGILSRDPNSLPDTIGADVYMDPEDPNGSVYVHVPLSEDYDMYLTGFIDYLETNNDDFDYEAMLDELIDAYGRSEEDDTEDLPSEEVTGA